MNRTILAKLIGIAALFLLIKAFPYLLSLLPILALVSVLAIMILSLYIILGGLADD